MEEEEKEKEKQELIIAVSMQLSGHYKGDLPKLEPLRRKIWNLAEDSRKYSMDEFNFNVYKKEQLKEPESIDGE